MTKRECREAFTEVYEILKLMPKELIEKIPLGFRETINKERSMDYYPNIKEPIEDFVLSKAALVLLSLIYRDFLCSSEEKNLIKEDERKELEEYKKQMASNEGEKINYNELLSNINALKSQSMNGSQNQSVEVKETRITVQEKKWYQKIFELIKGIFK